MADRPSTIRFSTTRFAAPLGRLQSRYVQSPLPRFLRWWGGELAALLPPSWRAAFSAGNARVLYETGVGTSGLSILEVRLEEGVHETLLASLPLADFNDERPAGERGVELPPAVDAALGETRSERERWLLLPGGQVLRRRFLLPAAATEQLREVMRHELDRQTPFRADQVSYDCRVLAIDPVSKQAQVELLVLPRDKLDTALAPLGALADGLSGVDARDGDGRPLHANLLPPEQRRPQNLRALWINLGLITVILIALLFGLAHALDNRSQALRELQATVDSRRNDARLASALGTQLTQAIEGAGFLARTRAAKPPMLAVLADISHRIPNSTWIERFSQSDKQIFLTGTSTEATALVQRLQGSPLLRTAALSGTVQPDAAGRDRFTLTAELAEPAHAPGQP
jgi:general secretion pathway protein L